MRISLVQMPFAARQFCVRMNRARWPASGHPVSLTRVLTGLRKSLHPGTGALRWHLQGALVREPSIDLRLRYPDFVR